jgi:hypothetical protein
VGGRELEGLYAQAVRRAATGRLRDVSQPGRRRHPPSRARQAFSLTTSPDNETASLASPASPAPSDLTTAPSTPLSAVPATTFLSSSRPPSPPSPSLGSCSARRSSTPAATDQQPDRRHATPARPLNVPASQTASDAAKPISQITLWVAPQRIRLRETQRLMDVRPVGVSPRSYKGLFTVTLYRLRHPLAGSRAASSCTGGL